MADSFEIMKLWVQLGTYVHPDDRGWQRIDPMIASETEKVWTEATKLAKDGWELVGTVPITSAEHATKAIKAWSLTTGFILLFKRRIEKA